PPERSVYVCNGDLALLFLSPTFYGSNGTAKRWLARGMARYMLQNAGRARRYRLLLANSGFTRDLMAFLYATPFAGVLYPPVDPEVFSPAATPGDRPYVVAVARNSNEQGLDTLRAIAERLPLCVIGGAEVPGATNVGRIADAELRQLFSGARFTVFPIVSELFGYAVAESLSCGTPVLTIDSGGPAEQVDDGRNGWRAGDSAALVAIAERLWRDGYPETFRAEALRSAERFALSNVARTFLEHLDRLTPPRAGPA
ncbi:MAG: glycosyltransferase, partial [Thermoplasmata archaeon]|nr:glycosyltransferase [Thermoplasmata archaeon]